MQPNSNMKAIFVTALYHVLIGPNTSSLQDFGGELLIFIRHHMAIKWEVIHFCLLLPKVKDVDLGIKDTSEEAKQRVQIVLLILVTPGRAGNHGNHQDLWWLT
jgi:hypothetical protein